MSTVGTRIGLLAALGGVLLATAACAPSGTGAEAEPTAETSASPSAGASETAGDAAIASTEGTFEFSDGTTVGTLADPWTTTDQVDGQLVHMIPGAPGSSLDDAVWGDIIVYVPDAAYGPGAPLRRSRFRPTRWSGPHHTPTSRSSISARSRSTA
jgi:hypothetical protein